MKFLFHSIYLKEEEEEEEEEEEHGEEEEEEEEDFPKEIMPLLVNPGGNYTPCLVKKKKIEF